MAKITQFKWGSVIVNDQDFKDVLLGPNYIQEWDWSRNGTRHAGINIRDFDFLSHSDQVESVVISKGVHSKLQCSEENINILKQRNIVVYHLPTPAAITKYNELLEKGEKVAALIHSTC